MVENFLEKRPWTQPLILLAGCILYFSGLFWLDAGDGIFWGFDMREFTYPYFDFISRELHAHGALPLWNPHQFIGFSLVGGGQQGLFYPPHWLILIMNPRDMVTVNLVLHVYLGMGGVAVLARRLGASRLGMLFAGLVWGGSGAIAGRIWAGHYTLLLPMGWLPWVLVAYLWAAQRGTWRSGLPAGAALALMLISGHPQISLIAGFTVLVLWGFEAFRPTPAPETPNDAFWQATRPFVVLGISAVLLAAVAILPVFSIVEESERANSADRMAFADTFSLPANQLFTFIFPTVAGAGRDTWADPNFEELFAYSGLLSLVALPILLHKPQRQIWRLIFLAAFGVLMAMALDGGLLRVIIYLMPALSIFRSHGRWLMVTGMALACLGGLLITRLQNDSLEERSHYLTPLLHGWLPRLTMALFAISFLLSMGRTIGADLVDQTRWWQAAEVIAVAGVMLLLITLALMAVRHSTSQRALLLLMAIALLDIWRVTMPLANISTSSPYAPIWKRIEAVIPHEDASPYRLVLDQRDYRSFNAATAYGYYDLYGYEPLPSQIYDQWIGLSNDPQAFTNRLLGLRYFVKSDLLPESEQENVTLIYERPQSRVYIYEINNPLPRVFFASTIIPVEPTSDFAAQYQQYNQQGDPGLVLVDQEPACDGAAGDATISKYQANTVEIEVVSETGGLLILTDRYAPGWSATVNGEAAEIYRANTIFRAVCVPPGTSTVVFRYLPISLVMGGVVSLISWLGVGLLFGMAWVKRS